MIIKKFTSLCLICILFLTACRDNVSTQSQSDKSPIVEAAPTEMLANSSETAPPVTASSETMQTNTDTTIPQPPQTALEFVSSMGTGWNLGNSFDPVDCTWLTDEMEYETAWGNPKVSKDLIHFIKGQGFDTIRIPVTWTNHLGPAPEYTISPQWLKRVQEVVDWCMEEDMYVILNIHHESNWLTKASTDYEGTMGKYCAIWTQLANHFSEYSDRLLFESMNEIGFDDLGPDQGCAVMNRINTEFTDLVRNCGGQNTTRYLILAGYWTDIDKSCEGIVMPEDDRVILSVHYYSPADFAIAESGTAWGYRNTWGTEEDLAYMERQFAKLKTTFLDAGIPVIMGEFGCIIKDKDPHSRILYLSSIADYCRQYGICPSFWDNGEEIDRTNLQWRTDGLAENLVN